MIVPHAAPIITPTATSTTWPVHAQCVHASQRDHVCYVGTTDAICGIGVLDTTRFHGVIMDPLALIGGHDAPLRLWETAASPTSS
jgi:hypothetical protein